MAESVLNIAALPRLPIDRKERVPQIPSKGAQGSLSPPSIAN